MKLKEYEGKRIFSKYGIPIPEGVLLTYPFLDEKRLQKEVMLKAQVFSGSRKKEGLICETKREDSKNVIRNFLKRGVKEILAEEKLNIAKEFYLAYTLHRAKQCYTLLFSEEGGIDIEELAQKNPKKILRHDFFKFQFGEIQNILNNKEISSLAKKLFQLFIEYDCLLAEINPLVLTKQKKFVAADSKIIIDDNSLFRHQEFKRDLELSEMEKKAFLKGLNYVELGGNIGVIGCGAGMVMATLDMVSFFGGKPACFLDVGGGASYEKMKEGLDIVSLNKNVVGIFINIFGGITHCDEIAKGIIEFLDAKKTRKKMVVRMIGTNEKEAKKMLEEKGIHCINSMEQGARKIAELVR